MCGHNTIPPYPFKREEQIFSHHHGTVSITTFTERVKRCAIIGYSQEKINYTHCNLGLAKKTFLCLNVVNDKAAGESRTALLLLKAGDQHTEGRTGAIPAFFHLKNY